MHMFLSCSYSYLPFRAQASALYQYASEKSMGIS
jgi:hypothetical protein